MNQARLTLVEMKRFLKRRRAILFLAPLIFVSLAIGAILWLPPRYESSISILVEKDETLNPMIQYTMAVAMASEDRLRSFNEILYSRSTINILIDSLGLADEDITRAEREALIGSVRQDIRTNLRASDSFSISYLHENPARAQQGVQLLSDHFIQTQLSLENRRNEQTLAFFENKLAELEEAVRVREERLVSEMRQNVETAPRENRSIQTGLDQVENSMDGTERSISRIRRDLALLHAVNSGDRNITAMNEMNLGAYSAGNQLQELLNQYAEYSQKYTSQYPGITQLVSRIHDQVESLIGEVEAHLFEYQSEKSFLTDQRGELVNQLERTTLSQQESSSVEGDYEVYKAMLDDMKVKVEQARSTKALGERSQNQFIVIDEANLPENPAEPEPVLLLAGGLLAGVFLGLVGAGVAELLDTTIRKPEDLKSFNKPVIAFIPNGKLEEYS